MGNSKMLLVTVFVFIATVSMTRGGVLAGYGRGPAGGFGGFGGGAYYGGGGGYSGAYNNGPATPYSFQYAVRDGFSGNDFGQHESGDGAGNVKGTYQVLLPDGRNQVVSYSASDATGYVADVQYSGVPHYGGGGFRAGAGAFAGHGAGLATGHYLPPVGK